MTLIDMLTKRFTYRTRDSWLTLIADDIILLNEQATTPDAILKKDDTITYIVKDYDEPDVPTDYRIEYETEDIVAVTKPPQVPVQQTGKIIYNTMTNLLRRDLNNEVIVPFHRIDRETSGLMIFAKNNPFCKAHQKHSATILNRKFYIAIVQGPTKYTGHKVSIPLGEDPESPIRTKMYPNKGKMQVSESTFYTLDSCDTHSLILVEIHTGRKHQIRAHCEYLGHSIIGDKIYSHNGSYYLTYVERDLTDEEIQAIGSSRCLLHSFALDLHLPNTKPVLLTTSKSCPEFESYADHFTDWQAKAKEMVQQLLLP